MGDAQPLPPWGPHFWSVMLVLPSCGALTCMALSGLNERPTAKRARAATAEGYLLSIFAAASLQLPFFQLWRKHVEGDLGMPWWVHSMAGTVEYAVIALRLSSGALSTALRGPLSFGETQAMGNSKSLDMSNAETLATSDPRLDNSQSQDTNDLGRRCALGDAEIRRCAAAQVLTMVLMGGAFYVWPFAIRKPLGIFPAVGVMTASIVATEHWFDSASASSATCVSPGEKNLWRVGSAMAAACGFGSAAMLLALFGQPTVLTAGRA